MTSFIKQAQHDFKSYPQLLFTVEGGAILYGLDDGIS